MQCYACFNACMDCKRTLLSSVCSSTRCIPLHISLRGTLPGLISGLHFRRQLCSQASAWIPQMRRTPASCLAATDTPVKGLTSRRSPLAAASFQQPTRDKLSKEMQHANLLLLLMAAAWSGSSAARATELIPAPIHRPPSRRLQQATLSTKYDLQAPVSACLC